MDINDWPDLDDGYGVHAPVGTFAANPFGLHDVVGNLWEWCLDGYDGDFYARSPRLDPVSSWEGARGHVLRGGSFGGAALVARSATRYDNTPGNAGSSLGVRPARAIDP
jgi:formylglycine-generating enzyme required for sulfatase activity